MSDPPTLFQNVRFLTGPVHAGFPSPGAEYEEKRLSLDDLVVPHPISTYYMRIVGDSMVGACLHHGDIIIVDRALTPSHNKIVVVRVGESLTLKRLQLVGRKVFLKPENSAYPVMEVTGQDYEIWGVVTYVLSKVTGARPRSAPRQ